MDDKLLEQIGHFVGQTRAEVLAITDDRIDKAVELVHADTVKKQEQAFEEVEELNKSLVDELNDTLKAQTTQHVEQIQSLTEQIKAQEIFEAQLEQRMAEVKDGESIQGPAGLDGQDKPLLEPVELIVMFFALISNV